MVALCLFAGRAGIGADRKPAAITVENVAPISDEIWASLRRYQDVRPVLFLDWDPESGGVLVSMRHENLSQLHRVEKPKAEPELLTRGDEPVRRGAFLPGGSILFSQAEGGDESYQIFRLDRGRRTPRLLTDGDSRNLLFEIHPDGERFAFSSTRRNGRDADVYLQVARRGETPERIFEVDGETWSLEDWTIDGRRAILERYMSRNSSYAKILDLESRAVREIPSERRGGSTMGDERVSRSGFGFGARGETLYFLSDARGEYGELVALNVETGATRWLSEEIDWSGGRKWDARGLELSDDRRRGAFTVNADGYSELYLFDLDGETAADRKPRKVELPPCLIYNLVFSPDGRRLGFSLGRPTHPSEAHSIDVESGQLTRWTFNEQIGFEGGEAQDFVEPRLIRYTTFDGRKIAAFVYAPPPAKTRKSKRIPVIITIHGGPESQYRPWFSPSRQYYVNELGAAVIAPNVRGSTGYGKTFSLLDNGKKREDSVRDIGALLDWIETTGASELDLDPERVAVVGGSYGGYMVLASLVHFGDRLRAGIDAVGISDFATFLKNTSDYRRHLRREEYGDERDPEMQAFFERISPARRITELKSALLLTHGENDPRVPFSEALQIVERARSTGQPVWTVYAANEGHGFRRKENRDYEQAVGAVFLKRFLFGE